MKTLTEFINGIIEKPVLNEAIHNLGDSAHPDNKRNEELFNKHIPNSGPAKHLEGELFRASSKIHHDYHNNGFGNNWSGAHSLLSAHKKMLSAHEPNVSLALNHLSKYKHGEVHEEDDDQFEAHHPTEQAVQTLSRATHKALDAADKSGTFGPHPGDMHDRYTKGPRHRYEDNW